MAVSSGVYYVTSRANLVDWSDPQANRTMSKMKPYAGLNDTQCQQEAVCRTISRQIPFLVNITDLRAQLAAVLRFSEKGDDECARLPACRRVRRQVPFL